jgi:hypothetical protein
MVAGGWCEGGDVELQGSPLPDIAIVVSRVKGEVGWLACYFRLLVWLTGWAAGWI